MHIIFKSLTNSQKLYIAKIESVVADNSENVLYLYGSLQGRLALISIPNAAHLVNALFHDGKLNLCAEYTAKFAYDDPAEQITIDFYKN